MTRLNQSSAAPWRLPPARPDRLAFYSHAGAMTTAARYAARLSALPADIAGLARIAQGLAIHEYMASAYGITIP